MDLLPEVMYLADIPRARRGLDSNALSSAFRDTTLASDLFFWYLEGLPSSSDALAADQSTTALHSLIITCLMKSESSSMSIASAVSFTQ